MTDDEYGKAKEEVKRQYEGWVLGSIKQTYQATKNGIDGSSPLSAFILTSCAIDFLAGFFCGIDSFTPKGGKSSKNYKAFVTEYMPQYDPVDVYSHVRCRLAHNFTIGGGVKLTHNHPDKHDPMGQKVINFENFLEDFESGVEKYFSALDGSRELREKFEKRWAISFLGVGPI